MVGFLVLTTCNGELQVNGVHLNRKAITYGDGEKVPFRILKTRCI